MPFSQLLIQFAPTTQLCSFQIWVYWKLSVHIQVLKNYLIQRIIVNRFLPGVTEVLPVLPNAFGENFACLVVRGKQFQIPALCCC